MNKKSTVVFFYAWTLDMNILVARFHQKVVYSYEERVLSKDL